MSDSRASRSGWLRGGLARLGIEMRPGEAAVATSLFFCFFLLITFQYATKSVRQSAFIDQLGAAKLPMAYLAVALLSLPILVIFGKFADRVARHKLIAGTCLAIAASLILCWWLFGLRLSWFPLVLYVWFSIVYVMTVSQFWSFSNHVLDARQAKRLFGFIGAGGLLGGVAGGQVAMLVSAVVDTRSTFLVAAALLTAAAGLLLAVHRLSPQSHEERGAAGLGKLEQAKGGLASIRGSRPLMSIASIMVLTVIVAQFVDLQFNWAVEQATEEAGLDGRTAFYGNFYSVMGISAFLFQLLFTARIHNKLGVGFAMRVLPTTMGLGTIALFVTAGLFPAGIIVAAYALKIGENGLRYSLDQVTRELLFLPIPSRERIKAKAFIDVVIQRSAKGIAGIALLLVTLGVVTELQVGWFSLVLIVLWLVVIAWAFREYVGSFREGLKRRTVDTSVPINITDATTLELLMQSLGSIDERQVLYALDILESHDRGGLISPLLLYHDDSEVRLRTLKLLARSDRRDAAGLIERRLGDIDPEVRAEAIRALAGLRGQDAADLMQPRLIDPNPEVRAAAIACLANVGDESQAAEADRALTEMLRDADMSVRAEAVRTLGSIRDPRFDAQLVRVLHDASPDVARQAIIAARRRLTRDGFNPIYIPRLVTLLGRRRLKHEAREALVAVGEPVVPTLAHFMQDPGESLWVRRALPKTLARIGTKSATAALIGGLEPEDDSFLRRKRIEATASVDPETLDAESIRRVESEIRREVRGWFLRVSQLHALAAEGMLSFEGPRIVWVDEDHEPNLLLQLLVERAEDHLFNAFALLELFNRPADVRAAHRSLLSRRPYLRARAVEYLDNALKGEVRRDVMALIDDRAIGEKLKRLGRPFGVEPTGRVDVLAGFLDRGTDGGPDDSALAVASLYAVYLERAEKLYPRVIRLAGAGRGPLVQETADWVSRRLGLTATAG